MRKSIILFWGSSLLATAVFADPGAFRAAIDVTQVEATGASWRVAGWIYDSTTAGFTGSDVATGQVLCCESIYRDVDIYTLDQIITQTVAWADFVCSYSGTGTAPRVGQPTYGQAYLSAAFGTNAIPLPTYTGPSGPSPSLRDGIAAEAVRRLASQGGGGGLGEQGVPGDNAFIFVTNTITLAPGEQAYASNNIIGTTNYVTIGIPRGDKGDQGDDGLPGSAGTNAMTGATIAQIIGVDPTNGYPIALAVYSGVLLQSGTNFNGNAVVADPDNGHAINMTVIDGRVAAGG